MWSVALACSTSALVTAQSQVPTSSEAPPSGPTITVVAQDQYFAGLPTSLPVGSRLRMSNAGAEVHQMIVARRVDGVTRTWDELLEDPDPVDAGLVELAGQLFAAPGQDADGDITIVEPGDYFAVCFVPRDHVHPGRECDTGVGAGAAPPPSAHYMLGMRQEFSVTAPGRRPVRCPPRRPWRRRDLPSSGYLRPAP